MQPKPHLHTLLRGFGCNSVFDRKAETAVQAATRPILRIAVKQIRGTMSSERAYSGVMVAIPSPKQRRLFLRTSHNLGTSASSVTKGKDSASQSSRHFDKLSDQMFRNRSVIVCGYDEQQLVGPVELRLVAKPRLVDQVKGPHRGTGSATVRY